MRTLIAERTSGEWLKFRLPDDGEWTAVGVDGTALAITIRDAAGRPVLAMCDLQYVVEVGLAKDVHVEIRRRDRRDGWGSYRLLSEKW